MTNTRFADGVGTTIGILTAILMVFGMGVLVGGCSESLETEEERAAIVRGNAEYIKRADGVIVFQWKEVK